MAEPIGFVILSHDSPDQLLRLTRRLNAIYLDPPIVCHHDFSQTPCDPRAFPSNVKFVMPHLKTGWAKWSVVEAALRALEILYSDAAPDWFVLLSAADYPLMPAKDVLNDLRAGRADAYLDYRPVTRSAIPMPDHVPGNRTLAHFATPGNLALSWRRYVGAQIWFPILRRSEPAISTTRGSGLRLGRYTISLPFAAHTPFTPRFKCYSGDHWFTANRKAAAILLNPTKKHFQLQRYLRLRPNPDECYYQTILCNEPRLRICKNTRRFFNWGGGGARPRFLTQQDLPTMLSSGAHFGRKFDPAAAVLDDIDEILSEAPKRRGSGG